MKTKATSITPFTYSKMKLHFLITSSSFDKDKQSNAFMPNLIHSLDATTLALLYDKLSDNFTNPPFFSIHDCFGTTAYKLYILKTLLASIYTDLYIEDQYLVNLDNTILNTIKTVTGNKVPDSREIVMPNGKNYKIHDIG
ncbi:hypothetical protein Vi05172_g13348 [Venturia inaequalis]|nr:hypothetical protein Vi05172_g13348 [Venturia inaequalis]